jgi:hypothetical protein
MSARAVLARQTCRAVPVYDQVARTTDCVYLRQVLVFSDDDTTGRAYADAAFDLMKALHYSPVGDGQ